MEQLISLLEAMKDTIDGLMTRLGISQKEARIAEVEQQASATNFWDG